MNSYQKLKKENAKLKRDIRVLIDEPNSYKADEIRGEYTFSKIMEEGVWFLPHLQRGIIDCILPPIE